MNRFTANQRLPIRKPHSQHAALAVNPPVERSETLQESVPPKLFDPVNVQGKVSEAPVC